MYIAEQLNVEWFFVDSKFSAVLYGFINTTVLILKYRTWKRRFFFVKSTHQRKELIVLQVKEIKYQFQALLIWLWGKCLEALPSLTVCNSLFMEIKLSTEDNFISFILTLFSLIMCMILTLLCLIIMCKALKVREVICSDHLAS